MEARPTLTEQLKDHEEKWVAILESENRIVGSGDSPRAAREDGERNGYCETMLFQVPAFDRFYIP